MSQTTGQTIFEVASARSGRQLPPEHPCSQLLLPGGFVSAGDRPLRPPARISIYHPQAGSSPPPRRHQLLHGSCTVCTSPALCRECDTTACMIWRAWISGVKVSLYNSSAARRDHTTTSRPYTFSNLPIGTYKVVETSPRLYRWKDTVGTSRRHGRRAAGNDAIVRILIHPVMPASTTTSPRKSRSLFRPGLRRQEQYGR